MCAGTHWLTNCARMDSGIRRLDRGGWANWEGNTHHYINSLNLSLYLPTEVRNTQSLLSPGPPKLNGGYFILACCKQIMFMVCSYFDLLRGWRFGYEKARA